MKKRYKFRDVIKATGATHSQISYWGSKSWVALPKGDPDQDKPKKEYSFDTLVRIALIKTLVDAGLEVESAAEVANIARWLFKEDMNIKLEDQSAKALLGNDLNLYILNIVNVDRIVYLSTESINLRDPKPSRLVSPIKLKEKGQNISWDIAKIDFESGLLDPDQTALLGIAGNDFRVEININAMMRRLYSIV